MLVNYCHFPTASVCTMVAHTLEFYYEKITFIETINELLSICQMTEKWKFLPNLPKTPKNLFCVMNLAKQNFWTSQSIF